MKDNCEITLTCYLPEKWQRLIGRKLSGEAIFHSDGTISISLVPRDDENWITRIAGVLHR